MLKKEYPTKGWTDAPAFCVCEYRSAGASFTIRLGVIFFEKILKLLLIIVILDEI